MRSLRRKFSLLAFGLAVIGTLIYAALPSPVAVDVESVRRGMLQITVDEDGKTRIKERYEVATPLGGRLARIKLKPGDRVVANKTLLAVIEPTDPALLDVRSRAEAEARVGAAEMALQRATHKREQTITALELAKLDYQRAIKLASGKNISEHEIEHNALEERAKTEELKAAEFDIKIAIFELQQAKAVLLRTESNLHVKSAERCFEIYSPIDGQVLRVFQESTTVVSAGARLLELGDPANLEVVLDVLSADATKVKQGMKVMIDRWGGDDHLTGRVRLVEPAGFTKVSALGVEEQRTNVVIDLMDVAEKWQMLGDEFRVEGKILIWEFANALKVPTSALFRQNDGWAVFVIVDGEARQQHVKIGKRNAQEAEVLEGLMENDQVIIYPNDKLANGTSVVSRR